MDIDQILDSVIRKQILSVAPDKLTFNDIEFLKVDSDLRREYQFKWKIFLTDILKGL